jgi:nucleoside-diphosphate-sugar epimerase
MNLLLLGGTAFLGRAIAWEAVSRGISVTCAARGSAPAPEGTAFVRADRDAEDGLAEVAGRRWDAVVDLTRQPGQARRAVRDLRADHWVLVSSGNVYARFDRPEQDESAPLLEPLAGDVMEDMSQYGPAKVACEEAVRRAVDSWTIVRSGLIGGAGDWSGRSGYYPWRFAHPTGADVLVPPEAEFPCALIDVADLSAWIVDCAQRRIHGTFNATGPTTTLGRVLDAAREAAGSAATARPVPADVLAAAGVGAWMGPMSLPLWIDVPSWRWFATMDTSAARARGLRTRPLLDTLRAALASEEQRTEPRGTGLSDAEERALRSRVG